MDTEINDPVSVWAFFDPAHGANHIFPIAMNWRRKFVKFERVIFASTKRIGEVKFLDLVCASETSNFELEYNTNSNLWRVRKVMSKD